MGSCFENVCLESPDIQSIRYAEGDLARLEREKNWESSSLRWSTWPSWARSKMK
jgi:hypothetical protein